MSSEKELDQWCYKKMEELLQIIREQDKEVASAIQEKHGYELQTIEVALDELLRALNEYSEIKGSPDSQLESARLHLVVRSFNSLLNAKRALEYGYYQQAMTLIRMVMEDQLVADDAEKNPATLVALLEGDGKIGKGELALVNMAGRISEKAQETWKEHYGLLSAYAAHPRMWSLRGLSKSRPDGTLVLLPGGEYDEVWAKIALDLLLRELVQVMEKTAKLLGEAGGNWQNDAIPVFSKVMDLWQDLESWAEQKLEVEDNNRPSFDS